MTMIDDVALGRVRAGSSLLLGAEALCAFGVAGVLTAAGARLGIDPETRIAQVSILASLQFAAAALGIALVAALLVAGRMRAAAPAAVVRRLVWAGSSGIASGIVAGGTAAALHGTPWPLFAARGDGGQVLRWAHEVLAGTGGPPGQYPPGAVQTLIWTTQLFGWELAPAQKFLQIVGVAAIGPLAYLAWRLVLAPSWAAAVGFSSCVLFLDPYKPIASISLVLATPLFVALVLTLHSSPNRSWLRLLVRSALLGFGLGLVFLAYSGWIVWCAPGVVMAGLFAFPWSSWRSGLLVAVGSVGAFCAVSSSYLISFFTSGGVADNYRYFDTDTDPAYFAAWFGDLPGAIAQWPPFGEFGGVGLFTIGLAAGMGFALAIGWHSWVVRTAVLIFAGAWLSRFWIAAQMSSTGLVQLYPRTNQVLLHTALICTAFALCSALQALMRAEGAETKSTRAHGRTHGGYAIGALTCLFLLASSIGSATADRYLPADDGTVAKFAFFAHDPYGAPEYDLEFCEDYLGLATCPR